MRNARTLVMNSGIEEEDLVFINNIYCTKIVIIIITFIQVVMKMNDLYYCRITETQESQGVNTSRNLFTRTETQEPALRPSNEHERCPKQRVSTSEMKHVLTYSMIHLMYILDAPSLTRFTLCFCNTPLCNTVPRHMGGKASTLKIQSLLILLTVLLLVLS